MLGRRVINSKHMNNHQDNHQDMTRHAETRHDSVETNQDNNQDTRPGAKQSAENTKTYSLTVDEAWQMFADAGHSFSTRSITRWCKKDYLDATLRPEENGQYEKWYVNKESVEKRIASLNNVRHTTTPPRHENGHAETNQDNHQDMPRHAETMPSHAESRHDSVEKGGSQNVELSALLEENDILKKEKKLLEEKLLTSEIEKNAAHQVRDHLLKQQTALIEDLKSSNYALGNAEARLQALEAPKPRPNQETEQNGGENHSGSEV